MAERLPIPSEGGLLLVGLGGSNKVMAGELSRLGRRALSSERSRELFAKEPLKVGPGALLYPFAPDLAQLAVNYHRTSARVMWLLHASPAERLEPLYEELLEQVATDERGWMQQGLRFSVLAFGAKSVAAGERQVVGVVKNALIDGAARRGVRMEMDPESPDVTLHARTIETSRGGPQLVVALDLAGRPMHQRGYRTVAGEAPLREDLAAQLVMLGRFDARSEVLIDPMAGSGTLAIEAALMAAGKPVWTSGRTPDAPKLAPLQQAFEARPAPLFGDSTPSIFAAECEEEAYGTLDRCLATAGTSPQTTTFFGEFQDWNLPALLRERFGADQRGLILSNPPYGGRLGLSYRELRTLYRELGQWCRQFPGFRAGFIVGEPSQAHERNATARGDGGGRRPDDRGRGGPSSIGLFLDCFGGEPRIKKPLRNGPLSAQFLLYDL